MNDPDVADIMLTAVHMTRRFMDLQAKVLILAKGDPDYAIGLLREACEGEDFSHLSFEPFELIEHAIRHGEQEAREARGGGS